MNYNFFNHLIRYTEYNNNYCVLYSLIPSSDITVSFFGRWFSKTGKQDFLALPWQLRFDRNCSIVLTKQTHTCQTIWILSHFKWYCKFFLLLLYIRVPWTARFPIWVWVSRSELWYHLLTVVSIMWRLWSSLRYEISTSCLANGLSRIEPNLERKFLSCNHQIQHLQFRKIVTKETARESLKLRPRTVHCYRIVCPLWSAYITAWRFWKYVRLFHGWSFFEFPNN